MSYSVTPGFIGTMYGINKVPPTVSDAQLAALLQPYLGTLPIAPFTLNMKLDPRDKVLGFLNNIYPGIDGEQSSQPSEAQTGDFAQSLQNLLDAAQTPQAVKDGEPRPIPPNSGGLARNTASTLGSIIASLQEAFTAASLTWPPTVPASTAVTNAITAWGGQTANQTLILAALAQLNQDVPVKKVTIDVAGTGGSTTSIQKTILLNQSLQEVLETEYVAKGSAIVYSGLQSLANQQSQAQEGIGLLSDLQTVYNGIQPISPPTEIPVFDTSQAESIKNAIETLLLKSKITIPNFSAEGLDNNNVNDITVDFSHWYTGNGVLPVTWEPSGSGDIIISSAVTGNSSSLADNVSVSSIGASLDLQTFDGVNLNFSFSMTSSGEIVSTNPIIISSTNEIPAGGSIPLSQIDLRAHSIMESLNDVLASGGDPKQYITDLPNLLPSLFPKPGAEVVSNIQLNGQSLSLAPGGTMQLLLNKLYQAYLEQAAQRLINADPNIYPDPNTGVLIVNPSLQVSNPTGYTTSQHHLDVINDILNYANTLITKSGGSGINLLIPGESGYPTSVPTIPTVTSTDFGTAIGGSFESNLKTVLQNMVGGLGIVGGDGTTSGKLSYVDNQGINITDWILGNWPTGTSDTARIPGAGLDQTQTILTNAFSSATSLNDSLQQQLKQSFFLFQQFVQSATSALSAINRIIVKMAQNISSR